METHTLVWGSWGRLPHNQAEMEPIPKSYMAHFTWVCANSKAELEDNLPQNPMPETSFLASNPFQFAFPKKIKVSLLLCSLPTKGLFKPFLLLYYQLRVVCPVTDGLGHINLGDSC